MYVCPACQLRCTYTEPDKAICGGCANLAPPCVEKEQFDDMMCYMDPCVACEIPNRKTSEKEEEEPMSLSRVNASAATLTKNRTEGSVVPPRACASPASTAASACARSASRPTAATR
jgi:hypothetical protein